METGAVISIAAGIVVSIITWLLNKTDRAQEDKIAAQQAAILLLFKKHDEDADALSDLKERIAREHYVKGELDARFQRLEDAFKTGFHELGAKIDKLADAMMAHLTRPEK